MIKVSIIVPAYNSENYLNKCLDSLVNQTLREIEIIVCNDGSNDETEAIVKHYQDSDIRVKLISYEKNMGQGYAKNMAIDKANGEYIGFVDSDDFVNADFFEKLYSAAQKYNSEIATASILKHKKFYKKYNVKYTKTIIKNELQDKIKLCQDKKQYFFFTTNKIYKASLIKSNNIKFSQGHIYEDVPFAMKSIYYANSVVSVPTTMYHYIERKNSTMKSADFSGKKAQDLVYAYGILQDFCRNKDIILPERLNYTYSWFNPFVKTYFGNYKMKDLLFGFIPYCKKQIDMTFPVDLVYLWVDGKDKSWLEKKIFWQHDSDILDSQAVADGRFVDNQELKFSLRSVYKYAYWINKIYIVTDDQVPKWLNIKNPKIKIVFHKDFIPRKNLPLFNSEAIETYLPFIPNLSEHFIYANDDTYLNKYINKFFFFNPEGKPIIRLKNQVSKRYIKTSMYSRSIMKMQDIIKHCFNKSYPYAPHHNIDSYIKSCYIDCLNYFKREFELTGSHKFRTEGDYQRVLVTYYMLANNVGILKRYSRVDRFFSIIRRLRYKYKKKYSSDSIVITLKNKNPYSKINKYKPKLFCTNDGEGITDYDRRRMRIFLEETFPDKSDFELQELQD